MENALKTSELQRNAGRDQLMKARVELEDAVKKAASSEMKLEHAEAELLASSPMSVASRPASPSEPNAGGVASCVPGYSLVL